MDYAQPLVYNFLNGSRFHCRTCSLEFCMTILGGLYNNLGMCIRVDFKVCH